MFVARRAFRNNGAMVTPGSILDPGVIKHFKSRLKEKVIIEVAEHDVDKWDEFFKARFGVSLNKPEAARVDAAETTDVVEDVAPTKTATPAKVVVTAAKK